MEGLIGIFFAPWIHHGWWHLISNSIPFLILGALVQFKNTTIFWEATLIISILAGLGTWLFGSTAYHAGASGLILGYWSFLLADAYNTKSIKAVSIATIVLIIYSGFFFVLLDLRTHISWIGHASGLVAGVIVAKLYFNSQTN
ncbi:MAG: rhomboid family intramembrane serine protease [Proteobacteria bacterium]|nr:rhomboid family intramembrane serine protease [Pseudomonadota bacterium]